MGDLTLYNKAIVAFIMAVIGIINVFFPTHALGVNPDTITVIVAAITPILVYLVPNKKT